MSNLRQISDTPEDVIAITNILKAVEGMQEQISALIDLNIDLTKRVGMLERANKKPNLISVRS